MQFTLISASAQSSAPYCLGYAFRKGDVPAGSTVAADFGSLQVSVRNRWSDGSVKFAQLAGRATLPAAAPVVITLRPAAQDARAGTALSIADLQATAVVAEVSCGTFGTVRWSGSDWASPFLAWVAGPVMSSWVYRKPVGSDPHLVAWLEVRLFAGGVVEVLPWVENGYLLVPGPTNKSATYGFSLGGTQRFSQSIDLKHHTRTPLVSGTALSHWLGTDPNVIARHDALYLQDTELVPSYRASVAFTSAAAKGLADSYVPLQRGNFNYDGDGMGSPGYQDPIGLLPQHDVLYLTCDSSATAAAVIRNGFSAGRYPIHYRDETTQRPIRFSRYPNLVLADGSGVSDTGASSKSQNTPAVTGGSPPSWNMAHSPSVGFMAYLLTGRWYFMEQVQFATTVNYLHVTDHIRDFAAAVLRPVNGATQTRSAAWGFRTMSQALAITPDQDDPLRAELLAAVEANIAYFHATYIAQPNNPFGLIGPGESYRPPADREVVAIWQQDFVTAAWGYGLSLEPQVSAAASAKMQAFFAWKARSVVGRLGTKADFWYVNAAPYTLAASTAVLGDYAGGKGPWYPDWAAIYAATYSPAQPWMSNTEGQLAAEFFPGEFAMWGNLQPALAYAVRHGVPGALTAYNRVVGAANWPTLRDAFNSRPVWGVRPARLLPAWMAGRPLNEWFQIPGTEGAGGSGVDAYCGFAFKDSTSEIIIAAAGGHGDSSDNRVVSLGLASDAPAWVVRRAASANVAPNVDHYPDGSPSSRHLNQSAHVIEALDRVFLFGARSVYGAAYDFPAVDAFNLTTNQWDAAGRWAPVPSGGGYGVVKVKGSEDIYTSALYKWSTASQSWSRPITNLSTDAVRWPVAHDSRRNQLFTLQWGDGQGFDGPRLSASRVPLSGNQQISVSFGSSNALTQFMADQPSYAGMDYDPDNDRFLFYCGQGNGAGRIYTITPNDGSVWGMDILRLGAGSVVPVAVPGAGVNNRFRYVPALKGFVMIAHSRHEVYFIRTA